MSNLPADWGMYYSTCDTCGERYHMSGTVVCDCVPCMTDKCFKVASRKSHDGFCVECEETKDHEPCVVCEERFDKADLGLSKRGELTCSDCADDSNDSPTNK